jgi:regulator of protease activity HflC (stomatin/prohibitin superfamily)
MEMEMFTVVSVVLAVVIVILGAKRVPQGTESTVERLGKYTKTLKPGFHVISRLLTVSVPR